MKKYILPTLISLALTLPVFAEESANTAAPANAPPPPVKSSEMPPAPNMDAMRQEHLKRMEEERQNFLQARLAELQQQIQDIQAAMKSPPPDMGQNGNPNMMNNQPNDGAMSAPPPPYMGRGMMRGYPIMQQHQQRVEDSLNRIEKLLEKIIEKQEQAK